MNSGLGPPESAINQELIKISQLRIPLPRLNLAYDKDPGTACDFA